MKSSIQERPPKPRWARVTFGAKKAIILVRPHTKPFQLTPPPQWGSLATMFLFLQHRGRKGLVFFFLVRILVLGSEICVWSFRINPSYRGFTRRPPGGKLPSAHQAGCTAQDCRLWRRLQSITQARLPGHAFTCVHWEPRCCCSVASLSWALCWGLCRRHCTALLMGEWGFDESSLWFSTQYSSFLSWVQITAGVLHS